jgi:hypothetical protein
MWRIVKKDAVFFVFGWLLAEIYQSFSDWRAWAWLAIVIATIVLRDDVIRGERTP